MLGHVGRVCLFATPVTVACQALLHIGFSRQGARSGLEVLCGWLSFWVFTMEMVLHANPMAEEAWVAGPEQRAGSDRGGQGAARGCGQSQAVCGGALGDVCLQILPPAPEDEGPPASAPEDGAPQHPLLEDGGLCIRS